MRPSTPRGLSRRAFLASGLLPTGAIMVACTGGPDLPNPVTDLDRVEGRDPMEMQPFALTDLRRPGAPEDPVSITVRGRRIVAVGEVPPADVEVIDLRGGVVVPGFVDCHVHMQFATAEAVLAGGVTTVRDLGSPPDGAQALRDAGGPLKVLLAGRILTPPGGYPTRTWGDDGTGREVFDADDAVVAVQEQAAVGATVIKVAMEDRDDQPLFAEDTLRAIVSHARSLGLRVTAHCSSAAALDCSIAAGVRELCHLPLHAVTPTEMVRAADAAMVLVPTLQIRGDDPPAHAALAAFRDAGGEVLYGSDLGNDGTTPGIATDEISALLAAGMTPEEVLRSATSDPALYLGLDTGRLEEGLLADIVVLGGDPFADQTSYRDIRLVLAAGEVVHRG